LDWDADRKRFRRNIPDYRTLFWRFFKCALDPDIPLQIVWTDPKLYPNDFRASEDHFDPFGAHITHFEQNHSCVTARDRTVWARTSTGYDPSTPKPSFSPLFENPQFRPCMAELASQLGSQTGSRGLNGAWQWAFACCSSTRSLVMCARTRIWRTRPSAHCSSTRTFGRCSRSRNFGCCARSRI